MDAVRLLRASATSRRTPSQFPGFFWRKSRTLEYHDERSPDLSQRQSGPAWTTIQVGLPIAPATCATDVQTVTTRSRLEITAAVSAKSSSPIFGSPSADKSFCKLTQLMPGSARSAHSSTGGMERNRLSACVGDPCQQMPTFNPFKAPSFAAQLSTSAGSGRRYPSE